MDQQLPPPTLVKTWINVIKSRDIPIDIINKRTQILYYYFGSIELAHIYVEKNLSIHRKAS